MSDLSRALSQRHFSKITTIEMKLCLRSSNNTAIPSESFCLQRNFVTVVISTASPAMTLIACRTPQACQIICIEFSDMAVMFLKPKPLQLQQKNNVFHTVSTSLSRDTSKPTFSVPWRGFNPRLLSWHDKPWMHDLTFPCELPNLVSWTTTCHNNSN